jgi:activator of 2-hydroxyglutaryl-CoA dehydratase
MDKFYRLGLDIGSTTIKVVLLDGEKTITVNTEGITLMFQDS